MSGGGFGRGRNLAEKAGDRAVLKEEEARAERSFWEGRWFRRRRRLW